MGQDRVKFLSFGGPKRLFGFLCVSGIGVLSDATLLLLLNLTFQYLDWFANIVSSLVGTTLVYLLGTRSTWKVRKSWTTFAIFIVWYAMVILTFSVFINWSIRNLGLHILVAKAITIPISFTLNYFFNRVLFTLTLKHRSNSLAIGIRTSSKSRTP
jgi:putative flippase GtrA